MPPPKLLVFLTLLSFWLSLQTRFHLLVSKLRTAQSVPRQSGNPSIRGLGDTQEKSYAKKLSQNRKQLQNVVVTMNQRLPRAIADTNIVRKRTEVTRDSFCFSSHNAPVGLDISRAN